MATLVAVIRQGRKFHPSFPIASIGTNFHGRLCSSDFLACLWMFSEMNTRRIAIVNDGFGAPQGKSNNRTAIFGSGSTGRGSRARRRSWARKREHRSEITNRGAVKRKIRSILRGQRGGQVRRAAVGQGWEGPPQVHELQDR